MGSNCIELLRMKIEPVAHRLAVCSWSLQPETPEQLLDQLQAIGLSRLQIALDPIRENPAVWGKIGSACAAAGVTLVSGMFGTVGEDYSTLDSIRRTGGLVPDATWPENWKNIQADAALAERLGLKLVTFHAGFLPHDPKESSHPVLLDRMRQVARLFAARQIRLALETGQETAATLRDFLQQLERENVGVNFDPANMILYDKVNPIEALRTLGPWLLQCHIKDALKTRRRDTWGEEVVVGKGEVDWHLFFQVLAELQFAGFCSIEREAGNHRIQDIRAARQYVETVTGL